MPISNVSGGLRSGVCTSTTRPSAPYEGQVIYETDTDRVLVWNNSAWVVPNSPAQNPTGLELVTTTTCSSGGTASNGIVTIGSSVTSVVINNAFSATYNNYKIIMAGGTTGDTTINLQLNGSSTGYYAGYMFVGYGGTTSGFSDSNTSSWQYVGAGRASGFFASFELYLPFVSNRVTGMASQGRVDATTGGGSLMGSGYHNVAASFTGFTFLAATPMTGGTVCVYGYRNS